MSPPLAANHPTGKRAIGIIRVSQVGGREGESFASPDEQRDRIDAECERLSLTLLEIIPEMDVSGGTPIDQRSGLRRAIEAVEAGDADVIVAAYFDRLVRSLRVQGELVERVEQAGGQVLAVDVGQITNGSAGQWLSGTMLGAVSEYQRRTAKERSAGGQARAVARGAAPWAQVPLGYRRKDDGTYEPVTSEVPIVRKAYEMRDQGASIAKVREMLKSHGVVRSHRGVQQLLSSRVYLGEIHFGKLANLAAHEPIIDRDLWTRVQRKVIPRGRSPKSDRLLARQGILRCGSCGARLCAMTMPRQGDYPIYRCPSTSDCPRHVTISAKIAEQVVTDAVRAKIADVEGRASAETSVRDAAHQLEVAQADLDAGFRAFAGFEDETAARERLAELRAARDQAQERLDQLGGVRAAVTITAEADWDRFTLDEQRDLIRATVVSATVAPGRGADRVTVQLVGE